MMTEPSYVTDKDVKQMREAWHDWETSDQKFLDLLNKIVAREVKPILEVLVLCAIPYEALLMDAGSRKWIEPGIWESMENGVKAARTILPPEQL